MRTAASARYVLLVQTQSWIANKVSLYNYHTREPPLPLCGFLSDVLHVRELGIQRARGTPRLLEVLQ